MKDATGGKLTGETSFFFIFFFAVFLTFSFSSSSSPNLSPQNAFSLPDPGKSLHSKQNQTTEDSWRKSHQWVGLTRKHAAATASDTVVAEAFKRHCTNAPDPDLGGAWRSCFSDEHYFPTLLAIGGWDSETVRLKFFFFFFFTSFREVRKREREKKTHFHFFLDETKQKTKTNRTARET